MQPAGVCMYVCCATTTVEYESPSPPFPLPPPLPTNKLNNHINTEQPPLSSYRKHFRDSLKCPLTIIMSSQFGSKIDDM